MNQILFVMFGDVIVWAFKLCTYDIITNYDITAYQFGHIAEDLVRIIRVFLLSERSLPVINPGNRECTVNVTVGFVPVTARWRSDSHTVTALCHSESEVRSDEEGELSSRRLQLPLAAAEGRFHISICPATDRAKVVKREDSLSTVVRRDRIVNSPTLETIS
ncbi:hypothetical protein AVEN_268639-1 [Araneus ventricosus]|uniref:Uncharacterized protein n=1 Tax=Araneus ventricosus TaxID=182803 RepID=A0A4Y2T7G0_ARAVE|nr:hypothetical protein AVEN_111219-1 [Araneus ventricosus]GBN96413.1 hypothetical protein AVEN_216181-1 [Araneus ventricosus]GBN96550.1 hypothetical protein AVEN_102425-1 [Araneus ventricosus]GBN96552.1 hypothetical protein AVEN_268639-1 [Araneus ventricosus]